MKIMAGWMEGSTWDTLPMSVEAAMSIFHGAEVPGRLRPSASALLLIDSGHIQGRDSSAA